MDHFTLLLHKANRTKPLSISGSSTDWPRLLALLERALELHDPHQGAWVASLDLCESSRLHLNRLLERHRAIQGGAIQDACPNTRGNRW